jgi:hypothetical protein
MLNNQRLYCRIMDKSEFFQEILDIHDNWTAIVGFIDIVKIDTGDWEFFTIKNEYNSDKINQLANELTSVDFWTIIGKGQSKMIIDALTGYYFEVDREGLYELKALLKWIPGDYDEYGRFIMGDYLDIEHIELNFISTFEARDRENKLNEILSDDFDKLFDL